jgi:hypothetical protein
MPIDLPIALAKDLRDSAFEAGDAWLARDIIDVDVCRISRAEAYAQSHRQHFNNATDVETFLRVCVFLHRAFSKTIKALIRSMTGC